MKYRTAKRLTDFAEACEGPATGFLVCVGFGSVLFVVGGAVWLCFENPAFGKIILGALSILWAVIISVGTYSLVRKKIRPDTSE